jgi:hypothetical protein
VQAALYLLALPRLLRLRLGDDYDPACHLGGAVYLFMRGLRGPEAGCVLVEPDVALLDALDRVLAGLPAVEGDITQPEVGADVDADAKSEPSGDAGAGPGAGAGAGAGAPRRTVAESAGEGVDT